MKLILASASPRRKELITKIAQPYLCVAPQKEESVPAGLSVPETVMHLACQKAQEVSALYPDAFVVGSDTVVCLQGEILGKPKDEEDAFCMLSRLSGKQHQVYTGVCVCTPTGKAEVFCECTDVQFTPMTEQEIQDYIASKEPMDKAGSYGIQGLGARFVSGIHGDYFTVMGLPVSRLYRVLKNLGFYA